MDPRKPTSCWQRMDTRGERWRKVSSAVIKPIVEILSDADELASRAAQLIFDRSQEALARNNSFTVALSGGSTPKRLYELLAKPKALPFRLPWEQIHFFWSDERPVGPDHQDSNYRMTNDALLRHVELPRGHVHRIQGELPSAEEAAKAYEAELRSHFNLAADELPRFDLILLGLGEDGHTASIFPDTDALNETRRLVSAPWVEKLNSYRITMTLPVLNNAATIVFLVSGEAKASMVYQVLEGEPSQFPAQAVQPTNGDLIWIIDKPAAAKLTLQ